jgi:hypothetical protein
MIIIMIITIIIIIITIIVGVVERAKEQPMGTVFKVLLWIRASARKLINLGAPTATVKSHNKIAQTSSNIQSTNSWTRD